MRPFIFETASFFLAATKIYDTAAAFAVACATARIFLICVHGFTFMVNKIIQQHFAFISFNFSKRELKSLLNFSKAFQLIQ